MVSGGSNTCNVLPRRQDEIKFILLLFPAEPLVREEIWEIELSGSIVGRGVFRYITADVSGYITITDDDWLVAYDGWESTIRTVVRD